MYKHLKQAHPSIQPRKCHFKIVPLSHHKSALSRAQKRQAEESEVLQTKKRRLKKPETEVSQPVNQKKSKFKPKKHVFGQLGGWAMEPLVIPGINLQRPSVELVKAQIVLHISNPTPGPTSAHPTPCPENIKSQKN